MSGFITRPTGLDVTDWTAQIVLDLDGFGAIGRLTAPELWQDWAAQLLNTATLGRALPDPYGFDNWQEWAERLCGALA